ncbi:ribonuclease P protein component [Stappia sp. GBMRC 2046]|uniref:Ribonuclease P protein component n=1 Tax=Stappia sediminis TaxID=2692190 RepID=A0A7X3LWK1_9HYPH|nr:ribonuclease P protein component [Stappia sediminis]
MPVLKKRSEFLAVAKGGRLARRAFVLQAIERDAPQGLEAGVARVGYTVTKKVGNAVVRNRVKRRLRAAVREAAHCARPGIDYVLIGRHGALDADFRSIVEELSAALKNPRTRADPQRSGGRRRPKSAGKQNSIH